MEIENHVLSVDVKEANELIIWASYCVTQMDYCINNFNLEESRYWNLEYQRVVNDLKALQFKKLNSERVGIDEKV